MDENGETSGPLCWQMRIVWLCPGRPSGWLSRPGEHSLVYYRVCAPGEELEMVALQIKRGNNNMRMPHVAGYTKSKNQVVTPRFL